MSSWRPEEDERLLAAVKEHGTDDWSEIAVAVAGGRSRKACRNRYRRLTVECDDADVEDVPNPLAVLQAIRDPDTGAPEGMTIFDLQSGRGVTRETMDTFHSKVMENVFPKIQQKLKEMGHEDVDYSKTPIPIDDLLAVPGILDGEIGDFFADAMVEPPPESSVFDQAVAAVSLQLGARCEDADEKANRSVRAQIEQVFGPDADINSPEVDAHLREFVAHQMRQLSRERADADKRANVDLQNERIAHDIRLGGPNGRLARLTIVRDKVTSKETIDEAYSDMDIIEKHVESWARAAGLTPRQFVNNVSPWELLRLLPSIVEGGTPDPEREAAPCQWTVRQNVERLYGITGHPITADRPVPYVRTPTQVFRAGKWKDMPHRHQFKAIGSDKNDRFPYKDGLTLRYKDDQILINKFSVWMGKSWVDAAYLIETSSEGDWKVVEDVFFCYGKDINMGLPYKEGAEAKFASRFEEFVSDFIKLMQDTQRVHNATYNWSTTPPLNESLCIPRRDSDNYPILIETKSPIIHSARAKSAPVPESYARRIRSGEYTITIKSNLS
jgi:hypothetical protein